MKTIACRCFALFCLTLLCFGWLLGQGAAVVTADPLRFKSGPTVEHTGPSVVIRFELSSRTDVEVAILNGQRKVVRHLAAGVVGGENRPPAPLTAGLSQAITWDGLDDFGEPVPQASECSARVRAGMGTRLDRIVGGDPYAFYSKEMGQGDHAAWRITGLETKADGKVYLLGNANSSGPAALRQYDAAGNYRSTVYPPPAGKRLDQVRGWGVNEQEVGSYTFKYNDLSSPALSLTPLSGTRGRIASIIPSASVDQLLLERDDQLFTIRTDGSIPAEPLLTEPLISKPALEFSDNRPRNARSLSGHRHFCLSPDGKQLFLGGVFASKWEKKKVGAEPTGFWRDGQIFQINLATRTARVFFALPEDEVIVDFQARGASPIAGASYGEYAALAGVTVDAQGHVFVCDRQNERIVILDPEGRVVREIPLAFPDAIAVSPTSNALFLTTRTGHYHGKGELRLLKFNDWTKDDKPAETLPLCAVHHYDDPTHLAAVESNGEVFVWVAYTALPARVYRDQAAGLELVKDFYEAGPQRALDLRNMCVDPATEHLYTADGFNACFRITDWNKPVLERCMIDAETPLPALSLSIDAHNRWLFGHADRKPVVRYHLDGPYFRPAPVNADPESSAVTPILTNDWRIGLGHGDRGIAAAPDGSIATLGELGRGPNYAGYLRFFQADAKRTPWEALPFASLQGVRAGGIRFDSHGNLYIGIYDKRPTTPPPGYEKDAHFLATTGRIFKYAPTGKRGEKLIPTEPAGPAKVYDIHYGAIGVQFTRTPRFGVDGYGRIYYPTSLLSRVSVMDNEGSPIHSFGAYGNRDSCGGLAGDLVPTKEIPLAWPSSVDATDDFIYVADVVNIRVLRIAKTFAAEATAAFPHDKR